MHKLRKDNVISPFPLLPDSRSSLVGVTEFFHPGIEVWVQAWAGILVVLYTD